MKYYIREHGEIKEVSQYQYMQWFCFADRTIEYRSGKEVVSTVFIGIQGNMFETTIFGGNRDGKSWHWQTEDQARSGHEFLCKMIDYERNLYVKIADEYQKQENDQFDSLLEVVKMFAAIENEVNQQ